VEFRCLGFLKKTMARITFKKSVKATLRQQVNHLVAQWQAKQPTFTLSTSGSTGKPKNITLSRDAIKASAQATIQALNLNANSKALLCLPINKVAGFMMVIRALEADWQLTVTEPEKRPLQAGENYDFVAMVPYQAQASWQHLAQINKLLIGGGPLTNALEAKIPDLKSFVYHSYGMTETITHVALRQLAPKPEAFYKALPGVTFSSDDKGCLVINAPHLKCNDLITNDEVELINPKAFIWRGRHDNAINVAGSKYLPEELEQRVNWSASNFMFTAWPHPQWGHQIALVLEQPQFPSAQSLKTALQNLESRQNPTLIFTLPNFNYTSNGKLQRKTTTKLLGARQPRPWPYT
jgi:O-succinylbenzoic acid--CoA ligase